MSKNEKEIIRDFLLDDNNNLKTALEVSSVIQDLVPELIGKLSEKIASELNTYRELNTHMAGWHIENNFKDSTASDRYKQLRFYKKIGDFQLRITIENQKKNYRGFIIGFSGKTLANASIVSWFESELAPRLEIARKSDTWFWYKYLSPENWNEPDALIGLYLDSDAPDSYFRRLINEFIELAKNADEALRERK